jgi:hypothetical protein
MNRSAASILLAGLLCLACLPAPAAAAPAVPELNVIVQADDKPNAGVEHKTKVVKSAQSRESRANFKPGPTSAVRQFTENPFPDVADAAPTATVPAPTATAAVTDTAPPVDYAAAEKEVAAFFEKPAAYEYAVELDGVKETVRLHYAPPPVPGEKAGRLPEKPQPPVIAGPGINFAALATKLGALGVRPVGARHALPLHITIQPDRSEKVYRLYADAAAAFVLRHILPVEAMGWMERSIKPADDIIAITAEQSFLHKLTEGLDEVPADSPDGKAVLAAARTAYDARRGDLARKFATADSWLFYPPADKAHWTLYRKGGDVIARTWTSDLMYMADFYFDMQKDASGKWQCKAVRGGEFFKGE